jgi:RNA polymerase sigma-70 factor (ECF subfamily)
MNDSIASSVSAGAVDVRGASMSIDDLFREHASRVYRMVASLVGPGAADADVQDLAQEVFLAAHRSLDRFRGDSKVETWLYGIATRIVLMHLRSWRRHRRLVQAIEREPLPLPKSSVEEASVHRDELRRVWRALMKITAEKRMVFVLSEIEEMSGKEIAAILEINEATVRTRLFHARKELIGLLEKEAKRDGLRSK